MDGPATDVKSEREISNCSGRSRERLVYRGSFPHNTAVQQATEPRARLRRRSAQTNNFRQIRESIAWQVTCP